MSQNTRFRIRPAPRRQAFSAERVAFVSTSYPAFEGDPSGHFVSSEAHAEARRGSRVTVLAPGHGGCPAGPNTPRVVRLADGGCFGWPGALTRIAERPSRVLGATRFVLAARRALRALGPFDRVVAHFIVPSGWPIALGVGCPLEVVGHGSDVRLLLRLPAPMRHAILAGLHSRGAKFRFVSAELRDRLLEGSLRRLRRVSIVEPCPLELPVPPSRNAARSTLGLPADAPLALVVGRLVRSKRPQVALNALSLLPGVQVVVVGDGPLGEGLAAKFPAVRLLGRLTRPETLTWIAAADVLVCTSRREGAPTVVREARRLGTPVVATPWGSLPDCERNDALLTLIASAPTRGGGEQ